MKHSNFTPKKGDSKMIFNILPAIFLIGLTVIITVLIIVKTIVKRDQIKSIDADKFNDFIEEIKKENADMKKDILVVKEKVEAIDKMMKDI